MPVVLTIPKDSDVPNILENPERWQRVQCVFPHSHEGDFILSFWQRLSPKNDYFFSFSYPCSGIGTFLPSRDLLIFPSLEPSTGREIINIKCAIKLNIFPSLKLVILLISQGIHEPIRYWQYQSVREPGSTMIPGSVNLLPS